MSWFILAGLLLLALIYTMVPVLTKPAPTHTDELDRIRKQLAELQGDHGDLKRDAPENAAAIADLERRALVILEQKNSDSSSLTHRIALAGAAFLIGGTLLLYLFVGSPNFEKEQVRLAELERQFAVELPLDVIALRLEQKLAEDPNPPPRGYQLLGRSLMGLGRFEEALAAYQTALTLSEHDPEIQAEYDRARDYVSGASAPALSEETISAFSKMPEDERAAMIGNMVESLSGKLTADPSDMAGWQRLLRSRLVMNQREAGAAELFEGLAALSDRPELQAELSQIARDLGYEVE